MGIEFKLTNSNKFGDVMLKMFLFFDSIFLKTQRAYMRLFAQAASANPVGVQANW